VPGTKTLGPTLTNFFCDAVTQSSAAITWGLLNPLPFVLLLAAIPFACVIPARRTTWRPGDPDPIRSRRSGGQILNASLKLYARHRHTFLTLGLIFIPVGVLTAALQWVLFHLTGLGSLVALDGRRGAVTVLFSVMIGDIGIVLATVLATAWVTVVLHEMAHHRRVTVAQAVRATRHRLRPLAAATVTQYGVVLLLTLTVVGIPVAIWRYIRWSIFAQACMIEGRTGREALARSSALVHGTWWRTFAFTLLVDVLTVLSGLIVGILLLLLSARSLNFIDIASSLVFTLTVPLAAIALTLYYFDLEVRAETSRAPAPSAVAGPEPDPEAAF
jgi:hypothetical protein